MYLESSSLNQIQITKLQIDKNAIEGLLTPDSSFSQIEHHLLRFSKILDLRIIHDQSEEIMNSTVHEDSVLITTSIHSVGYESLSSGGIFEQNYIEGGFIYLISLPEPLCIMNRKTSLFADDVCKPLNSIPQPGSTEEIIYNATSIISIQPNNIEAYLLRGKAFVKIKAYKRAIADLSKLIELDKNLAEGYYQRGLIYIELNYITEAAADLNKAYNLGIVQAINDINALKIVKDDEADYLIDYYTKEIDNHYSGPSDSIFFKRGNAYRTIEDYTKAIEDYSIAIEIGNRNSFAFINRGICYYLKQDYENALKDFKSAKVSSPQESTVFNNLACVYLKMGDINRASQSIQQALDLGTPDSHIYCTRGEILTELEDYDRALYYISKAISMNPKVPHFYICRGKVFQLMGEIDKAENEYAQANQIEDNIASIKKSKNYFRKGMQKLRDSEYYEAIEFFDEAININPKYSLAYYQRGMTYKKINEKKKAREDIKYSKKLNRQK